MPADDSVLVTGGAGFIGAYVTRALLAAGRRVLVYDLQPKGNVLDLLLPQGGERARGRGGRDHRRVAPSRTVPAAPGRRGRAPRFAAHQGRRRQSARRHPRHLLGHRDRSRRRARGRPRPRRLGELGRRVRPAERLPGGTAARRRLPSAGQPLRQLQVAVRDAGARSACGRRPRRHRSPPVGRLRRRPAPRLYELSRRTSCATRPRARPCTSPTDRSGCIGSMSRRWRPPSSPIARFGAGRETGAPTTRPATAAAGATRPKSSGRRGPAWR